jgi:adenylosuccinate lyase
MTGLKKLVLPAPGSSDRFSAVDPLDSRYYDPETARYLSERSRIAYQAHVEAALAKTLADFGICSAAVARKIEAAANQVTVEAVYHEEQTTKHDIKALVNCIKSDLPPDAQPYVHFGATSYDIISTAASLQIRTAVDKLLVPRLRALLRTLLELTKSHAHTVQIGRTHGQHAVPVTFGFAMAEYVSRLGESLTAIQELSAGLRGKFSGAVGAYNALGVFVDDPMQFEKTLLGYLGLQPAPYSTQIVPAENTIRLLDELAITAGIMANLAHDMRHLQRSEIAEVRERFETGQTGSSTMAHKRNPWNFENVISMSKQVTAQLVNANLNISSEHQRDLTDSASSRFYSIVFATVASMAERLNRVMGKLEVDQENMQRNLHLTKGAIAAEPLYLLLEKYGHTAAHEKVKTLAHAALTAGLSLYEAAQADQDLTAYWTKLTDQERLLIKQPEANYSGLAAQKALTIYRYWHQAL